MRDQVDSGEENPAIDSRFAHKVFILLNPGAGNLANTRAPCSCSMFFSFSSCAIAVEYFVIVLTRLRPCAAPTWLADKVLVFAGGREPSDEADDTFSSECCCSEDIRRERKEGLSHKTPFAQLCKGGRKKKAVF